MESQVSMFKGFLQRPQEYMVGLAVVVILAVMVMPIPVFLLDLLLSFSLTFALIVLLVSILHEYRLTMGKVSIGLDLNKVFNAISSGAAQSWQLDNRFHTMVKGEFDFGFGIDLMIKDLKIAINQANRNNVPLKTVQSILDEYIILSEMGGGDQDTSSLIKSLQNS